MIEKDKNETTINIYLDLSKSFDTIMLSKEITLNILKTIHHIDNNIVEFDNTKSDMLIINTGVPNYNRNYM